MSGLIVATGLVKAFGLEPVLRGLNFEVAHGAAVSLLGANGSGKTTLLRILAGLSRPTAGQLTIGGWRVPDEVQRVRLQLGVVSHQTLLYDDLTAEENLRFFARLYDVPQPAPRIAEALAQVGLSRRSRDLLRTFSRGMQQRMAIARAMIHDPSIYLLDEPFTGLDIRGVDMLNGLLQSWKAAQRTIIMTSHDLEHAATFSDHVLMLSRGKIAVDAPTASLGNLREVFEQVTAS